MADKVGWSVTRLSGGTVLPITVEEVVQHCRLLGADYETSEVEAYILAATELIEQRTRHILTPCTFKFSFDTLQNRTIPLPFHPVTAVTGFYTLAQDGLTWEEITSYLTSLDTVPAYIYAKPFEYWPLKYYKLPYSNYINFSAGYNGTIPHRVKHALKLLVANFYEQRTPLNFNPVVNSLPYNLDALLSSLTVLRGVSF